jgi:flagellar secretion chaperone FliS
MSSLTATLSAPSLRPATAMPPRAMPGGGYGAARYRDAELSSQSPGQLVVLLFDKMLLTLRRARVANDARLIELRCECLLKASDMIDELRFALDHERGGIIAANLDQLYGFMLRELMEANRRQDSARIDVAIRIAGELRDAFAQLVTGAASAAQARST